MADLDLAGATETARRVDGDGRRAVAVHVDTTDEAANDAMVRRCVDAFGAVPEQRCYSLPRRFIHRTFERSAP